jgi:hypothetical protein
MHAQTYERSFAWLASHTDKLRLRPRAGARAVKKLAELATLAQAVRRFDARGDALLAFAWDELRRGAAIAELLAIDPVISLAYLPFVQSGLRSPDLEHTLATTRWQHATWPALRQYAVGFLLESIGVDTPWSVNAALARLLGAECERHVAVQVIVIAHVVLWRTAIGTRDALSPLEREDIVRNAPFAARRLIDLGAIDPLCELVCANTCASGPPMLDALAEIASAQRPDGGVLPYRSVEPSFANLYHSTLVAAIATGLQLRKEHS